MANKRELKKTINCVCGELFAECIAVSLYGENPNMENMNALLSSIAIIQNDYICKISHPEPGLPQKKFFKHLSASFNEQVSEVFDHIGNVH